MKKTIVVIILAVALLSSSALAFAQSTAQGKGNGAAQFTDVSGHWAQDTIGKLAERGAIFFMGDKFIPEKAVTRSEFAVMLHKALGIQIAYLKAPDIKDYFTDVKPDAPYASALIDLMTANILEGKGSFRPEGNLPREEIVHYIINAYKYKMGEDYKVMKISPASFKDNGEINPVYSGDVARASYLKLVVGSGLNLFHPKDNATRAEAAAVIENLVNLLEKEKQDVVIQPYAVATGDSLEMKLSIINHSKYPVIFSHSSGLKYDFVLLDADKKELYRWSEGKVFTMMLTDSVIEAGKTIEYDEILDKDLYKEIKDKIIYLQAYVIGSSNSFTINHGGYEIRTK